VGRGAPPQGKRGRWGGRRRHKAGTGVREGQGGPPQILPRDLLFQQGGERR